MARVLTLRQAALRIGRTVPWLYKAKNRKALEARGFPPPLPTPGQIRYDGEAIDRWLDAQMPPALRPTSQSPGDQWASELDKRAATIAAQNAA
jgi:predicted DNA-binding transcriptional regulator AlpA